MDKEDRLVQEIVENAMYRMDESTRMIKKSLAEISEEEIWQKPNPYLNSMANLILHLCGNMTQYVISSIGEIEDNRDRDAEFSVNSGLTKEELLHKLIDTVDSLKRVIFDSTADKLIKVRSVQGMSFSGVGAIMHAVEHYSYHTGQIAFYVKLIKEKDLGFYDGVDLNIKNE